MNKRAIKKEERKNRRRWKKDIKNFRFHLSKEEQKVGERKKEKKERAQEFLLNYSHSKLIADKSQKLRCQITGCREGATTLLGKKKVCQNHSKKEG